MYGFEKVYEPNLPKIVGDCNILVAPPPVAVEENGNTSSDIEFAASPFQMCNKFHVFITPALVVAAIVIVGATAIKRD